MAACRLVLLLAVCAAVAVECQRVQQSPRSRTRTRQSGGAVSRSSAQSGTSARSGSSARPSTGFGRRNSAPTSFGAAGRTSGSRTAGRTSGSRTAGRTSNFGAPGRTSGSRTAGRTSGSRAAGRAGSTSRSTGKRRTSAVSRASSSRGSTSQAQTRTPSGASNRAKTRTSFGSNRAKTRTPFGSSNQGKVKSTFGSNRAKTRTPFGSSNQGNTRTTFGSNRAKTRTPFGSSNQGKIRPTFGSNRAKARTPFGSSNQAKTRPPFGSSNRSKTRTPFGSSRNQGRGGAQKKNLLKQSPKVNFNCREDGFFPDGSQCDKYFECREGVAKAHTCPDGLLFAPNRTYPCVYPVEADCDSQQQRAQPTEDCPRQYATFRSDGDPANCAAFTRCINGVAYPSSCAAGLAFDARSLGCEWADTVAGCDAAGYLGFRCPAREFSAEEVGEFTREPHPDDCTKYYICLNKEDGSVQPRLQGCPEATVFDPATAECSDQPDQVPGCEKAIPAGVLAAFRQRKTDEEERREARLAQLRAKLQG